MVEHTVDTYRRSVEAKETVYIVLQDMLGDNGERIIILGGCMPEV